MIQHLHWSLHWSDHRMFKFKYHNRSNWTLWQYWTGQALSLIIIPISSEAICQSLRNILDYEFQARLLERNRFKHSHFYSISVVGNRRKIGLNLKLWRKKRLPLKVEIDLSGHIVYGQFEFFSFDWSNTTNLIQKVTIIVNFSGHPLKIYTYIS